MSETSFQYQYLHGELQVRCPEHMEIEVVQDAKNSVRMVAKNRVELREGLWYRASNGATVGPALLVPNITEGTADKFWVPSPGGNGEVAEYWANGKPAQAGNPDLVEAVKYKPHVPTFMDLFTGKRGTGIVGWIGNFIDPGTRYTLIGMSTETEGDNRFYVSDGVERKWVRSFFTTTPA